MWYGSLVWWDNCSLSESAPTRELRTISGAKCTESRCACGGMVSLWWGVVFGGMVVACGVVWPVVWFVVVCCVQRAERAPS